MACLMTEISELAMSVLWQRNDAAAPAQAVACHLMLKAAVMLRSSPCIAVMPQKVPLQLPVQHTAALLPHAAVLLVIRVACYMQRQLLL